MPDSELNDQSLKALRAWELIAEDIYHSIPITAVELIDVLRSMPKVPLRLQIDMRAVAFRLPGYFLFQDHFFVSSDPENDTVGHFTEAFNQTDPSLRPQLFFSFLETLLEFTDPECLARCFRRILSETEPCLDTVKRAAEVDIVELVVTFTMQCQVDPSNHPSGYAEDVVIPTQLSIFGDFVLIFRVSRHNTRRIFAMAAKRLHQRLRPLLLWLFVGSMPNRAKRFVNLLVAERQNPACVLSDLLGFLERRWKECPVRADGVRFCPYFGPISCAIETGFNKAVLRECWKGKGRNSPFQLWYMKERGQERNSEFPAGSFKRQWKRERQRAKLPKLFSKSARMMFRP